MRSDEQLVALFRAGNDDAFRAIHDRYRARLFAYARQMLPGRQDAEDALQDVFLRAYAGLRSSDRELALRAWLYRVAHNRCIDELRRPVSPAAERIELHAAVDDPVAHADRRESLRRLVGDIRRLPEQQRSALLMRELGGVSYAEIAAVLGISVPAVKSLLVRARIGLVQAGEARDASCSEIRTELMLAHDRRVRPGGRARRHMRDCAGCREFRRDLRGVSRQLAALGPALGPLAVVGKILGVGGGAGGGAAASGGSATAGGAAGSTGVLASSGAVASGVGHVATLLAATVVAAGGAVAIQHTIGPARPAPRATARAHHAPTSPSFAAPIVSNASTGGMAPTAPAPAASASGSPSSRAGSSASTSSVSDASGPGAVGSSPSRVSGIGLDDQLTGAVPPNTTSGRSTLGNQSIGDLTPDGTIPPAGTGTGTRAEGTASECTTAATITCQAPPTSGSTGGTGTGTGTGSGGAGTGGTSGTGGGAGGAGDGNSGSAP